MNKFIFGLTIALSTSLYSQTNYYACSTGSNDFKVGVGGTCNLQSISTFNSNDTLFIQTGLSTDYSDIPQPINGVIIIEGDLDLGSGSPVLTIGTTGAIIIKSGGSISGNGNASIINNGYLEVQAGGTLTTGTSANAVLTISGTGEAVIDGVVTIPNFVNDGTVTGTGQIVASKTVSGSGTVNGDSTTTWHSTTTTTLALGVVNASVWDGTAWSNGTPSGTMIGYFNGDYPGASTSESILTREISITSGVTVSVADLEYLIGSDTVTNEGTIVLSSNAMFWTKNFFGNGSVTLNKAFSSAGWKHISFPVTSGTCGDLLTSGFILEYTGNPTNIYTWSASTSGWSPATAGTSLAQTPFALYIANASHTISYTIPNSQLNIGNNTISQSLAYHNPGTNNPGNANGWTSAITDGWNFIANPFPIYLDWDIVRTYADLTNTSKFQGAAVYIWDGSQYQTYNTGGTGAARFISPNQAFFVQTTSGVSATFDIDQSTKNSSPATATNYFKKPKVNVLLHLKGQGYDITTEIVEQADASDSFDPAFDAYYLAPVSNAPKFHTFGTDSLSYGLNQIPSFKGSFVYLNCEFGKTNKSFTITKGAAHGLNQKVFIEDLHNGLITNLSKSDYVFRTDKNAPTPRFKVYFDAQTMVQESQSNAHKLESWITDNELNLASTHDLTGSQIQIFTIDGKLYGKGIYDESINIEDRGIFLVKVILTNGEVLTTKLIK